MANPEQLEEQREETRLIIEELLEDGSDPDALYTIEHHLSADDLETLEKGQKNMTSSMTVGALIMRTRTVKTATTMTKSMSMKTTMVFATKSQMS